MSDQVLDHIINYTSAVVRAGYIHRCLAACCTRYFVRSTLRMFDVCCCSYNLCCSVLLAGCAPQRHEWLLNWCVVLMVELKSLKFRGSLTQSSSLPHSSVQVSPANVAQTGVYTSRTTDTTSGCLLSSVRQLDDCALYHYWRAEKSSELQVKRQAQGDLTSLTAKWAVHSQLQLRTMIPEARRKRAPNLQRSRRRRRRAGQPRLLPLGLPKQEVSASTLLVCDCLEVSLSVLL